MVIHTANTATRGMSSQDMLDCKVAEATFVLNVQSSSKVTSLLRGNAHVKFGMT